jgi:hypothetical protein
MLLVTMALLAGASAISVLSVRSAATLESSSAKNEARNLGELVEVVSTQVNRSGSYIWLYNYGWVDTKITSVYVHGARVVWASCETILQGALCVVTLAAGTEGLVTLVLGDKSIAVAT